MTRIIRFPGVMNVPADHPKFLMQTITDRFTRVNAPLGGTKTTTGDKEWSSGNETVTVTSGQVSMAAVTVAHPVHVTAGGDNYEVEATLAVVAGAASESGGGLLVRLNGKAGGYVWLSTRISGSEAGYSFWENTAAANVAIGTPYRKAPAAGDVLKVRAYGDTLTAWVNGVLACTAKTTRTTGNGVGFLAHLQGTATRWDNFSVSEPPPRASN